MARPSLFAYRLPSLHQLRVAVAALFAAMSLVAPAQTITSTATNGPITISIHARTSDGKLPLDAICTVVEPQGQQAAYSPPPLPLAGSSGDWVATNVPPGYYEIWVRGTNYADDIHNILQFFHATSGSNYSISFALSRGATFSGRVFDADTGRPVANAIILGETQFGIRDLRTDAAGRFEIAHVTGSLRIEAQSTNLVGQVASMEPAAEDAVVTVPDFQLHAGGWISGRITRPNDAPQGTYATIKPVFEGSMPSNWIIPEALCKPDDTFLAGPLPPGPCILRVEWQQVIIKGGPNPAQRWHADGEITGIKVEAGKETTGVVIETKSVPPAGP